VCLSLPMARPPARQAPAEWAVWVA
jgi:hypothetical protein